MRKHGGEEEFASPTREQEAKADKQTHTQKKALPMKQRRRLWMVSSQQESGWRNAFFLDFRFPGKKGKNVWCTYFQAKQFRSENRLQIMITLNDLEDERSGKGGSESEGKTDTRRDET